MVLAIYCVFFVDNDHALMKGCLDDDLEATILLLEQKYPFDTCPDHPKKWCFNYWVTNKHFDLTHPQLLVWAAAIVCSFFACCAV